MIYLLPLLLLAAEDNAMKDLVNKTKTAALSTMHKEYPYASLVPYVVDKSGRPIIFISDLAAHTKNLKKNEKCSLMATKVNSKDIFNSARITFIGKMKKVPDKEIEEAKKVYLEKYPDSEKLLELEDFSFYRMEIDEVNYIGGFGDINWYDKEQYNGLWK
jgi:hypothetical protein